jgi:hypothetical protein
MQGRGLVAVDGGMNSALRSGTEHGEGVGDRGLPDLGAVAGEDDALAVQRLA